MAFYAIFVCVQTKWCILLLVRKLLLQINFPYLTFTFLIEIDVHHYKFYYKLTLQILLSSKTFFWHIVNETAWFNFLCLCKDTFWSEVFYIYCQKPYIQSNIIWDSSQSFIEYRDFQTLWKTWFLRVRKIYKYFYLLGIIFL